MTGIQIPVDANISALQKKIDALGRKIDEINRKKWNPVDTAGVERDAPKVEQTLVNTKRRVRESDGGPTPSGVNGTPSGNALSPRRHQEYGLRKRYTYAPEFSDIPRHAIGGFGGGFAQIASAGSRGAIAGAQGSGGIGGGIMGLLRGAAIGALAFGAFKVSSEGLDMARERAGTLDTLKRQMGDVGISFERLKVASDSAAYGLGIMMRGFISSVTRSQAMGSDGKPTRRRRTR